MFNKLKHTFKQTGIYSLGNISTKLIGLILLPLYTEYLTLTEYGIWAILDVTNQILIGALALNLPLAMLRWSSAENDNAKIKSIIFTTIISLLLIISVCLFFLLPSVDFFSNLIFDSTKYSSYFFLLFILSAFGMYNGVPLNIIRIKEKSFFYVIITTLKFTIILILNIYFIVYEKDGVYGIIKSQLIGEIFLTTITLPIVLKSIIPKFDSITLIDMVKYGSPLIFSTISSFILSFGDRYILQHYLNEADVGAYSLGYKIASVLNMLLLQSFQMGFLPIAYKKLGDSDEQRFFSKILTYYTIILTFVGLSISMLSREIIEVFAGNPDYWIASTVVPIITLAFVIKGIQYNFALSFHYAKKTMYNAIVVVITAVISFSLNILLIQQLGIQGSAISMLISITIMMFMSYYLGNRVYPISFEIFNLTKMIFIGIVFYSFSTCFSELTIFTRLVGKLTLLILFPIALYFINIFEEVEKIRFKELINKIIFWKHDC